MEKQKNIPDLRFPIFNGEWERKKLKEVAKFFSGGTPLTSKRHYFDGEIPFIRSGEINSTYTEQFITEDGLKNSSAKMVQTGDVLYALYGATSGEVAISKISGAINQAILCIRSTEDHYYIYSYLELKKENIIKSFLQGGQGNLSAEIIKNLTISLPTLPEQQKIASFFTAIDQKISQFKQKKILLEQYKKGVMQKIFNQEIRFKDDEGRGFSKWEKNKFSQIYSFIVTNSFSRDNLNYEDGQVKNIHYGDIHTKFNTLFDITKEDVPFINPDISIKRISSDNYCKTSDIVFADASEDLADVGKSIELVNLNNEKILSGLHTILARPDLTKIASGFGGYLMKSIDVRKQIMKVAQGSKVTSISSTRLCDIELNIPCPTEQIKIANFMSAIDDKINQTQKQIEKVGLWKKGLLQQMFV